MKKLCFVLIIGMFFPMLISAQPFADPLKYNIEKEKVLYTVGYAHLDTEWNWDYPQTINVCIKNTMEENFRLFEKYPDYVFNFTGSRRYRFMKEYYPEMYKKVAEYIKQGKWFVSGSSVDEGEVNISSSESLIRQVLYGNYYFRKEFGKESADYMLPDCFGFLSNLPSIWNHCGLLGFSTQKLTWKSAAGLPFNVGVWNGPDGKGIIAALNASNYTGHVNPRLDIDKDWVKRMDDVIAKYGFSFDYRYYGVGDEGGGPRENDVINAVGSLRNADAKLKVVLTSSDQMYKDITPELRKKLPVYAGDLLLIEHSAGSMTSQAYMKRMNRKNENLAQAAEQSAVVADWLGAAKYPVTKLNEGWDLVLGSQFHDILPGTSIPKAYEYAWNDEFVAANCFSEVLTNSLKGISQSLNTNTQGRSLVVYNTVSAEREDVVTAELSYTTLPANIQVFDKAGKSLPTQIIERNNDKLKFIFLAKLPSMGMSAFDVRESNEKPVTKSSLKANGNAIENDFYTVKVAANGDIESVFDKKVAKEILAKPARLEFLKETPAEWPSWNMDWKDRQQPAFDYLDKEVSVSILENGPVRVSLLVKRKGQNSMIEQVISLAAGDAGKRVEVTNKLDWQSKGVSLKASFPLTVNNENATYNQGVGTIQRNNNDEKKFEVPSKEWFDLTDKNGKYGVSILEDCKFGSDKPADNTLRLTLLYTPGINKNWTWCSYQGTQDWGVHDIKYGIYGHRNDWTVAQTQWQAKFLNQPLVAFESSKHEGVLGKEFSIVKSNSPQVSVMAFKKMEESDYYMVRVNELNGKDAKAISLSFAGKVIDAYEVNGQEKKIGAVDFKNGNLNFDITHYTIRSFAVKLQTMPKKAQLPSQVALDLPYNFDWWTNDDNRHDCNNGNGGKSYPAELIPAEIVSEDIVFKTPNAADRLNNTLQCAGQTINLPAGDNNKLYLLAAATEETSGDFVIDGQATKLTIQEWTGFIGQYYNRYISPVDGSILKIHSPYTKRDNIAWFATHRHESYPTANEAYQFSYMYKYEINLPTGAKTLVLPDNKKIKVFAITLAKSKADDIKLSAPLYDDFANTQTVDVRK
jgi:alpha-mannosidase